MAKKQKAENQKRRINERPNPIDPITKSQNI